MDIVSGIYLAVLTVTEEGLKVEADVGRRDVAVIQDVARRNTVKRGYIEKERAVRIVARELVFHRDALNYGERCRHGSYRLVVGRVTRKACRHRVGANLGLILTVGDGYAVGKVSAYANGVGLPVIDNGEILEGDAAHIDGGSLDGPIEAVFKLAFDDEVIRVRRGEDGFGGVGARVYRGVVGILDEDAHSLGDNERHRMGFAIIDEGVGIIPEVFGNVTYRCLGDGPRALGDFRQGDVVGI